MNHFKKLLIIFGLILGLLTGCAVLRVDVDVYKGPLADEEHVQVQRLAVMAIGAKPLLIQARDMLAGDDYINKLRDSGRYREKFVTDDFTKINNVNQCIENCKSQCNNNCSYEMFCHDQCEDNSSLSAYAFATNNAGYNVRLKSARIINSVLYLYQDDDSSIIRNLVSEGRYALNQFTISWNGFLEGRDELREVMKKTQSNENTYALFNKICQHNSWYKINKYKKSIFDVFSNQNTIDLSNVDKFYLSLLDNQQTLNNVAIKLFKKQQRQNDFLIAVNKMANNFNSALMAQKKLLRVTLLGIIELNKERAASSYSSQKRLESAVDLIVSLGRYGLIYGTIKGEEYRNKENRAEYQKKIKEKFLENPAINANKLLSIDAFLSDHKLFNNGFCTDDEKCALYNYCQLESNSNCGNNRGTRPYGLIYLPNNEDKNKDKVRANNINDLAGKLAIQFNDFSVNLAGFEKGRLSEGLETLIQLYLEEYDKDNTSEQAKLAQKRLSDALTRFAEKLLYVSQNSAYIDVTGISGNDPSKKDEKEAENIFRIIEVVGNSILVQANELIARKNHKKRMNLRYNAVKRSIESEFLVDKNTTINRILASIDARTAQIEPIQKQIAELIKTKVSLEKALKPEIANKAKLDEEKKLREENQKNTQIISSLIETNLKDCVTEHSCQVNKRTKRCKTNIMTSTKQNTNKCSQAKFSELAHYHSCLAKRITTLKDTTKDEDDKETVAKREKTIKGLQKLSKNLDDYSKTKMCSILEFKNTIMNKVDKTIIAIDHSASDQDLNKKIKINTDLITAKNAEISKITSQVKKLEDSNKLLKNYTSAVIKIINDKAQIILNQVNQPHISADIIMSQLKNEVIKIVSDDSRKALSILNETAIPAGAPADLLATADGKKERDKDARDAMDSLIAWLETNRIKILHDQGRQSPAYISATAALEEAYRDRSGMSYIRPTSSYLRSSYTSTAVQQSNPLGWNNMLADSEKRMIPFIGENIVNKGIHKSLNEIDKQFWQNINTVRVSGGGLSNYVLVKDDVGNWGVRSFSTSYKETVEALGNMATFNYSEKLTVPIANKDGVDSAISPESSGLPGLFANYRESFKAARTSSYSTLKQKLEKSVFIGAIETKWDANTEVNNQDGLTAAKESLQNTYEMILTPLVTNLDDETITKKSDLIYDLLRALRKYKSMMAANLTATLPIQASEDPNVTPKNPAMIASTAINAEVDAVITAMISSRGRSIKDYEKALLFIGEATNRDAKAENK